jgi:23S rRNA (guanine2445-N2)-methyltransferase / 23S rRNA (guanine2069-N7)-methyltransferase
VRFQASPAVAYRVCYRSRVASRVLLVLRRFPCPDARALYGAVRTLRWAEHFGPDQSVRVDFVGTSPTIRQSHFGALKVKDAIVDAMREATGGRPSVDLDEPDVRVRVRLAEGHATLALDLSGAPLHQRGVGRDGGPAPLKESLAAAVLHLAGWPAAAAAGLPLVDPMCGSGTLLTEAAGIALGHAAGRSRRFGFERWRGHDAAAWAAVRAETDRPLAGSVRIHGSDLDPAQVARARENAARAGVASALALRVGSIADIEPPRGPAGLVVTNPPYGERLGEADEVAVVWRELGDALRQRFLGWHAWVLAGSPQLAKQLGLRPAARLPLHNGPLDGRLLSVPIADAAPSGRPGWRAPA